jgi:hypothetical protein
MLKPFPARLKSLRFGQMGSNLGSTDPRFL